MVMTTEPRSLAVAADFRAAAWRSVTATSPAFRQSTGRGPIQVPSQSRRTLRHRGDAHQAPRVRRTDDGYRCGRLARAEINRVLGDARSGSPLAARSDDREDLVLCAARTFLAVGDIDPRTETVRARPIKDVALCHSDSGGAHG